MKNNINFMVLPRLPDDLYVNSVSVEPGYAALSILASSKTFKQVKECDAVSVYDPNDTNCLKELGVGDE